jgi:HEAT repeat protein
MECVRVCAAVLLCLSIAAPAAAQSRGGETRVGVGSPEEAAALAQAWNLLSQRSYAAASAQAQEILRRYPRSVSALTLAVEASIAYRGAVAGLDDYEGWMGQRRLEEPGVLRTIARAVLADAARNPGTRLVALRGLAGDGDESAAAALTALARQGGGAETRALAAMGDQWAAAALVAQLDQRGADPVALIDALGDSGYAAAVGPITARLTDPRPEVRGKAAEALGKLATTAADVSAALKPLLSDGSSYVRTRAAAALYRLGDSGGTPWLQELAASDIPSGRLVAAEAMACRPDQAWLALVTDLVRSGADPEVRLGAARLLASHDADLARSVAQQFGNDGNPAIRELAAGLMADTLSGDGLATLRGFLRTGDDQTRLRAAVRVLALTR